MDRLDLDGDGRIDYNEFMQAAINHQALLNKENITQMFKLFDANNDGMISISELKSAFSAKAQKGASIDIFIKEVMTEVDKNRDNMISYDEFNNAMTSILKKTVKWK